MKKAIILTLLILASIITISVATDYEIAEWYQLQITLVNQKPDPVAPGEYVDVRFKIENRGTKNAEDVAFELMPRFPFSLEPGESSVTNVGSVWGRQIGDLGVMIKYKLMVDKDAVEGINHVKARYKIKDGDWITLGFNISIQTRVAVLSISSVDLQPEILPPGGIAELNIGLENLAGSVIENVRVKLDFTSVPFATLNSSNELSIKKINPGAKESVKFLLIAEADADADVYKIPITLRYQDELANNYTASNTLGVRIGDKPELIVGIEKTDVNIANTYGTITIKFVNRGLADIKLLSVKLESSNTYEIINSDEVYVGNIDSDDYETADFKLYVKDVKGYVELPLKVVYRDANNNQYQDTYKPKLRIYSAREAEKIGLKKASYVTGFLIIIVIVGVGIYLYKRTRR